VRKNIDDVGFVSALLDHLEDKLCLDRRRVFASGMSNGGLFSHRLACDLSERIAGIAAVAGTDMTGSCAPTRPVSVLQIHGTADGHVPWQGGEGCGLARVAFTSIPATMEAWRTRNRCASTKSPGFREGNGACETFDGCAAGRSVTLCTVDGGGHSWPGGVSREGIIDCPGNGPQSQTFGADEAIWRFFAQVPVD
jgi:polyhydroxybutyrate depolymerase